jgi:N-acyl-D-aspartate/D-glutamate deacylase
MLRALLVLAVPIVQLGLDAASSAREPARYDVVIRGGRVLDGRGNPFFHADVAIDDDRIALIGSVPDDRADRTIDAQGLLREGDRADVTIFDPVTLQGRSTYERPHAYSEGIRYVLIVLINGTLAADGGELAGEVLAPRASSPPSCR